MRVSLVLSVAIYCVIILSSFIFAVLSVLPLNLVYVELLIGLITLSFIVMLIGGVIGICHYFKFNDKPVNIFYSELR